MWSDPDSGEYMCRTYSKSEIVIQWDSTVPRQRVEEGLRSNDWICALGLVFRSTDKFPSKRAWKAHSPDPSKEPQLEHPVSKAFSNVGGVGRTEHKPLDDVIDVLDTPIVKSSDEGFDGMSICAMLKMGCE